MTPDLRAKCEKALRALLPDSSNRLIDALVESNLPMFIAGYVLAMEEAEAYVYRLPVETNEKRRVTLSIAQWCCEQITQAREEG